MKIIVLQDRLRGGGTERQSVFLAQAFAAAGHATTLVTFRPGGVLAAALPGSGVTRRTLQPFDTGLDWFAPGLQRTLRTLAPDVVLCMGRMANCHGARIQAALPRAAVVATLRTGKPLPAAFRKSLRAVRHIVANSAFVRAARAVPLGADDRCTVISNALLFPELFAAPPEPRSPPMILNVAQFRRGKGQSDLIEACLALPRDLAWRLELVGDGPERGRCERVLAVVDRLSSAGLADRIVFHGWQENPLAFYRQASIAALASLPGYESLPNFLVEAQCAGVPVVTTDADGAAECLVDGRSGLVVPAGDRPALTAALATLLRDAPRRAAMSAVARDFARVKFDPKTVVGAYLDLFGRLIARPD